MEGGRDGGRAGAGGLTQNSELIKAKRVGPLLGFCFALPLMYDETLASWGFFIFEMGFPDFFLKKKKKKFEINEWTGTFFFFFFFFFFGLAREQIREPPH